MDFENPESALVAELRALAKLEGPLDSHFLSHSFNFVHEGVRVFVKYSSGSSSSITIHVRYDEVAGQFLTTSPNGKLYRDAAAGSKLVAIRPMRIHVLRENALHEAGKRDELDVEHQTGDEKFDSLVYIDAPSAVPLPQIFSSEILRAAILELIFKLEFRSVHIDNELGEVAVSTIDFPNIQEKTKTRGADAVAALVRLAKTLPQVVHSGEAHPADPLDRPSLWMGLLGIILFLAGAPIYFLGAGDRCGDETNTGAADCCWPGVVGLILAIPCAIIAKKRADAYARRAVEKTSSTSSRVLPFASSAGILVLFVVWIVTSLTISHAAPTPPQPHRHAPGHPLP